MIKKIAMISSFDIKAAHLLDHKRNIYTVPEKIFFQQKTQIYATDISSHSEKSLNDVLWSICFKE